LVFKRRHAVGQFHAGSGRASVANCAATASTAISDCPRD
jgi:hypothetical protein